MNREKALYSQLNIEDINELNTILMNLHDFLNSRNEVTLTDAISGLLNEIALAQSDSEKLCIINSRDTELLLRGGTGSLNYLRISALNDHITENEKYDNQRLAKYKDSIGKLFTR